MKLYRLERIKDGIEWKKCDLIWAEQRCKGWRVVAIIDIWKQIIRRNLMKIYIDEDCNTLYQMIDDRNLNELDEFKNKSDLLMILSLDFPEQYERAKLNEDLCYLAIERFFNEADQLQEI